MNIEFICGDKALTNGFLWAKEQAQSYVHDGNDPVGLWYEAALPLRQAFCIRDICHGRTGASVLGLDGHTKNMLYKFAKSIDKGRDYCMFWEITKDDLPAEVDYTNDNDFWYNLPANFDMIRACYDEFLWSGDDAFIKDEVFLNFYKQSVNEYIKAWDKDLDGILEHYKPYGRRGISSYNEQVFKPFIGADLLGAMFRGYMSYSMLLKRTNDEKNSQTYYEKAQKIKEIYLDKWYRKRKKVFYGALKTKNRFYKGYYKEGNFLPVFFGILDKTNRLGNVLKQISKKGAHCVEAKTYFPELFYERGMEDFARKELMELVDPKLQRREYPEVSFCVLGVVVNNYMGITPVDIGKIKTLPRLNDSDSFAKLNRLPIQKTEISVFHQGNTQTTFVNHGNTPLTWRAVFKGHFSKIILNGETLNPIYEKDAAGNDTSFIEVDFIEKDKEYTAKAVD